VVIHPENVLVPQASPGTCPTCILP